MSKSIKTIDKDKEESLLEKGYIKAWMLFEVQSNDKELTGKSMLKHLEKLNKESCHFTDFVLSEIEKVEAHEVFKKRGIEHLYSQVAEVTLLTKDLDILTTLVINYGPSALEILRPEKITLTMREAQNILSSVADMIHKFAQAGIGGMLLR